MAVFDEQYVMSNLSPNNQRPFREPLELPDVANTLDMDDELKADSYTGGLNVNRGILQSLTDKGKEAFGFIKDKGSMIGGGIASAITGIPFLGTAFNAMQRPEYPSDAMSKSFAYGNENSGGDLGYYDALRHGNLNGQDQFGINTVSALGNYPAYYSQYVKDYEDGKYSITSKFGFEKYMHGKNVINKNRERIEKNFFVNDDNDGNDNITYTPPSNNQNGGGGGGGGGAPPGFGSTAQGNYTNQFEGGDPGQGSGNMSADDFSDDTEGTPFAKGGRARYFFGGRVNYKAGGRTNYVRGGAAQDMGNAENQAASAAAAGTSTSAPGPGDTGGEGGNNPSDGSDTQFSGGDNGGGNPPTNIENPFGYEDNTPPINVKNPFGYENNIMKSVLSSRYGTDLEEDIPKFTMENMFGITSQVPENMQLAKVYGAPELTKFGATPGTFMDTDKFNDMEKYQELANKQMSFDPVDGSYRGKQPSAIRESIALGDALYGINMDNIPKDFLETQADYKNQKILGDIKFSKGGRAMFKNGGLASIL